MMQMLLDVVFPLFIGTGVVSFFKNDLFPSEMVEFRS